MPKIIFQKQLCLMDEKGITTNYKLLEKKFEMNCMPFAGLTILDEFGLALKFGNDEVFYDMGLLYSVQVDRYYDATSRDDAVKIWLGQKWQEVQTPKFRRVMGYNGPSVAMGDDIPAGAKSYHYFENEGYINKVEPRH